MRISRRVQQNEAAIFVQGSGLGGARPKATSSAGSLIRTHKSYIQQRYTYDGQCKAAGLSNMHGLRHRYAQDRYEALADWKTPAAQRALDAQARQAISRESGHERTRSRQCIWDDEEASYDV
ncbi:hypothetical protein [Burkholderia sp. COPS]|uniref:hypothetical protein n=1 Tax=Burkholderia sp. COPS TaxID=2597663 RepID=UPI0021552E43|nr:hypothetical protein [Burkholderia sp. COPS]